MDKQTMTANTRAS